MTQQFLYDIFFMIKSYFESAAYYCYSLLSKIVLNPKVNFKFNPQSRIWFKKLVNAHFKMTTFSAASIKLKT